MLHMDKHFTSLTELIPNEKREPLLVLIDQYQASKQLENSFHLQYLKQMLRTGEPALARPYDKGKIQIAQGSNLEEQRNARMKEALTEAANNMPAPSTWQYSDAILKQLQTALLGVKEVDNLKQELNNFLTWANNNTQTLFTNHEQTELERLMVSGFLFNVGSTHFDVNNAQIERNNLIAQSGILKRVGQHIFSSELAEEVINDCVKDRKSIAGKTIYTQIPEYASGKTAIVQQKGESLTQAALSTFQQGVDDLKKLHDFKLMPKPTQDKILKDFQQYLLEQAANNPNKAAISTAITQAFNASARLSLNPEANLDPEAKKLDTKGSRLSIMLRSKVNSTLQTFSALANNQNNNNKPQEPTKAMLKSNIAQPEASAVNNSADPTPAPKTTASTIRPTSIKIGTRGTLPPESAQDLKLKRATIENIRPQSVILPTKPLDSDARKTLDPEAMRRKGPTSSQPMIGRARANAAKAADLPKPTPDAGQDKPQEEPPSSPRIKR